MHCARLLFLLSTGVAFAQDPAPEPVLSGPPAGSALPACRVYAPSGTFAGKEFDAAAQIGDRPGALLFVHELSRNTGPMITGLDKLAVELAWTGLQTHTVRIAMERSAAEIAVERSSTAMNLQRPILVTTDGAEGPGGYALHRKATLTLVLCKDGKVVRSIGFTDTGRGDLGRLRGLVEEVTGPIPTDADELRERILASLPRDPEKLRELATDLALLVQNMQRSNEERMQRQQQQRRKQRENQQRGGEPMQQGAAPKRPREGKAPDDDTLRDLLRRAIQKAADAAELDAVFAAVDARVGDDDGLKQQAIAMWKLMLSLDYGNDDSKRRANAWLEHNGGR